MGDVVQQVGGAVQSVFAPGSQDNFAGVRRVGDMFGNATGFNQYDPNFYQIDTTAFDPNAMEASQTERLSQRAMGQGGPSPAELQMQAGLQAAQAQAQGTAAAQRGVSPALAARLAQQYGSQAATQTNQQAGLLRAQEQLGAEGSLAQALQSQRQGRMQREALQSGQSLGQANIGSNIFEGQADRQAQTFRTIGQAASAGMYAGGKVQSYQMGGMVPPQQLAAADQAFLSGFAQQLGQLAAYQTPIQRQKKDNSQGNSAALQGLIEKLSGGQGGTPMTAGQVSAASPVPGAMAAQKGAVVPGKAVKPGDHPANDKVPAMLSPGEIIVPRTVAQMSPKKIAEFVKAIQKENYNV